MTSRFALGGPGGSGLVLFLVAGDPPLALLPDILLTLDRLGVDAVELAVPFPNSVSDGPVIRESASRALERGVGFEETLAVLAEVTPRLNRLEIALFADWRYTVKGVGVRRFTRAAAAVGAHGILVHALPPTQHQTLIDEAAAASIGVVTTCYASSPTPTIDRAADDSSAYVYLVARYGRTGAGGKADDELETTLGYLRARTHAPVAVGFGVRTSEDLARVRALGADAAIVGTAFVETLATAQHESLDVIDEIERFVTSLIPAVATAH